MRLKSIEIANFKAFGKESQTIPIKPITPVVGPNSAGKSSLVHSLLWLNHAESRGETDVYYPSLVGKSVNLGGFDSCLNRKSGVHRLRLALTIENSALNPSSPKWSDTISHFKLVFTCGSTHKDQSPGFIDCDLFANDDRLLTIRKRSGILCKRRDTMQNSNGTTRHCHSLQPLRMNYRIIWKNVWISGRLCGRSLTFLMSKLFLQQSDEGFLDKNENIPKAFHQFLAHELPASIGEVSLHSATQLTSSCTSHLCGKYPTAQWIFAAANSPDGTGLPNGRR